jgi:hypothetical protein
MDYVVVGMVAFIVGLGLGCVYGATMLLKLHGVINQVEQAYKAGDQALHERLVKLEQVGKDLKAV